MNVVICRVTVECFVDCKLDIFVKFKLIHVFRPVWLGAGEEGWGGVYYDQTSNQRKMCTNDDYCQLI